MIIKELKTVLSVLLVPAVVICSMAFAVSAQTEFSCEEIDDETCYLKGCISEGTDIVIPETYNGLKVTSIGNPDSSDCFYFCNDCPNLETITVPATVTNIAYGTFDLCENLKNIYVDEDNTKYCDVDGILYNKTLTKLIKIPGGKDYESFAVPNGVKTIYGNTFSDLKTLKSVVLPSSVTSIPMGCFQDLDIEEVTFTSSVKSIDENAFYNCRSLKTVNFKGSEEEFESLIKNTASGNKALTALADSVHYSYILSFDTDGGRYIEDEEYIEGETVIPPQNPVKSGCSFLRWEPSLPATMPAENLTVTALWTPGNHNYVFSGTADSTCTEDGYEEYICTDEGCGETYRLITEPKTGHIDEDGDGYCDKCQLNLNPGIECDHSKSTNTEVSENFVAPTCRKQGSVDKVIYCSECSKEISRNTIVLEITEHTPGDAVKENEKEPTCTADGGYDETVYCIVCGDAVDVKHTVIPATGHKDENSDRVCDVCGTSLVNVNEINFIVPSGRSVDYMSKVSFTVKAENVPPSYTIEIYSSNNRVASGKDKVEYKSSNLTYDTDFKAVLLDGSGNEVLVREIKVTVKRDFFTRLIAFFRRIFRKLPTVPLN